MASNRKQPFRIFPFPIWSFSSKFALLNCPLIRHDPVLLRKNSDSSLSPTRHSCVSSTFARQIPKNRVRRIRRAALDYLRISRFIFVVSLTRIPMTFSSNSTVLLRTVFRILDKNNISAKNTIRGVIMKKQTVGFDRTQDLLRWTDWQKHAVMVSKFVTYIFLQCCSLDS